jgi:hypothetical protein
MVRFPVRVAVAMSCMLSFSFITFATSNSGVGKRGAALDRWPLDRARKHNHHRTVLTPAPAPRCTVAGLPAVAALVVGEPAEDTGLDRTAPAAVGHRGGVAVGEGGTAHGGPGVQIQDPARYAPPICPIGAGVAHAIDPMPRGLDRWT